jgi:ABC-2 type transport system ATP-binding protein
VIAARELSKLYGDFQALDSVSCTCESGQIYGIVGHNGAGKTTLLKIMAGLLEPTSGALCINGTDAVANPDAIKQSLGYLSEESRLYENLTAIEYLRFFGEIYGIKREDVDTRAQELFTRLSLDPGKKKLGQLSKGMKRKVAIARTLLHDPTLLIYDEPSSGLDPMTSRFIVDYLKELKRMKKTIVLSAHNLYQIEEVCDRVMILKQGKVVVDGSMSELRDMFGSTTYEIWYRPAGSGEDAEQVMRFVPAANEVLDALNEVVADGGKVDRIESQYPSLEEIMMKIERE